MAGVGAPFLGCSWRPEPGSESSDSAGAGSPAYPNALDLAGLASSGPGFRPPPPRAPLSPGQRKKPTPRPPPRALTSALPPSRGVSRRQPAARAPARPFYKRRHGNAILTAELGRGVACAAPEDEGEVRWQHPANYSPLQRCEPSPTCPLEDGETGSVFTEVAPSLTAGKEQTQESFLLTLALGSVR